MSGYLTISRSCLDPSIDAAERYKKRNHSNFFDREINTRKKYLKLLPLSFGIKILDTFIGVITSVGVLCTFGLSNTIYTFHARHMKNSKLLLADPFKFLLKTVNPNANFPKRSNPNHSSELKINPLISVEGDGFTATSTIETIQPFLRNSLRSPHFFHRHLTTRLTHIALATCCVAHRIIDAQIALLTAPLALITLGKIDSLNNIAYRSLQTTGIINDLVDFAIKIINPFAGHTQQLSGGILAKTSR